MTISARQSVEQILCSSHSTSAAYPINGYAFVGQCADMLWSNRPEKTGHDPG